MMNFDLTKFFDTKKVSIRKTSGGCGGHGASSSGVKSKSYGLETKSSGSKTFQRPITAVQSVGFVSKQTIGGKLKSQEQTPPVIKLEDEILKMERTIKRLVNRSLECLIVCDLKSDGLVKAKEAVAKEQRLELFFHENSIDSANYNYQLKFLVLINICEHYEANEMLNDAIEVYEMILKNDKFINSYRYILNMANIYFRQQHYQKALKIYQISLDKTPASDKSFRLKCLENYTIVLMKNGKFKDSIANLQYILQESQFNHKAAYHLFIIYLLIESDMNAAKSALETLIRMPYKYQKRSFESEAVNDDKLLRYHSEKIAKIEQYILTGSKLLLQKTSILANFDWLIQLIKKSQFTRLIDQLDIFRIILLVRNGNVKQALDGLCNFNRKASIQSLCSAITLNLSFLYNSIGDLELAEKFAKITLESKESTDREQAGAFNNLGVVSLVKCDYEMARECFLQSLQIHEHLIEPKFNLALVYKLLEQYDQALMNLQMIDDSYSSLTNVVCQKAAIFEALRDHEATSECYQELLALVPTDSKVLEKLADLALKENNMNDSIQYRLDAYHYLPSNIENLKKLADHYRKQPDQIANALKIYRIGTKLQPDEIEWHLSIADCFTKTGNLFKSFDYYRQINERFPANLFCVRTLIELAVRLDQSDAKQKYEQILKSSLRSASVRTRTAAISTAAAKAAIIAATPATSVRKIHSPPPPPPSQLLSDSSDNEINIINFENGSDDSLTFDHILPE